MLIGIGALLLTPPEALSAYLHAWVQVSHRNAWGSGQWLAVLLTEFINILVLMIHSRNGISIALEDFEMSLPMGRITRWMLAWIESALIQLPSLFLLLIACLGELLAYGHAIRFQEFFIIVLCFIQLILLNHIMGSQVKRIARFLRSKSWLIGRKSPYYPGRVADLLRVEVKKILILERNCRR